MKRKQNSCRLKSRLSKGGRLLFTPDTPRKKNKQRLRSRSHVPTFTHCVVGITPKGNEFKEGVYKSEIEAMTQAMCLDITVGSRNAVRYEVHPLPYAPQNRTPLTQSQLEEELCHV